MAHSGGGASFDPGDIQAVGLEAITQGITLTLAELKELGIDSVAGVGRGFSNLELSGLDLGHEDATEAFTSFCERWEWGVRSLVAEGNGFAEKVGLSAGTLYETDQYIEGALKVGANSLMGNPYADEDQVAGMSWKDLAHHNAMADADYSKDSFDRALANSKQGWRDAGRDVMTSNAMAMGIPTPLSAQDMTGASDAEYNAMLDATFGPSPEERAEAEAQRGSAG